MRLTPIALALLALPLAAQESQSYSLAGEVVALYNIAGSVTVQGGGRGPVTFAVSRTGPDAARLTVETIYNVRGGFLTTCTVTLPS